MNICYATNMNFVPHTAVSITSLLENLSIDEVYIHILHANLDENSIGKLLKFEERYKNVRFVFHKIDITKFEQCKISINHISKETYFRYFIAELLPDVKKILYLDGDTVVNGDISELFDVDLTGFYCAGVKDVYIDKIGYKKEIGVEGLYINAGVILFNLEEIRNKCISEKFFDLTVRNDFKYQDQDVINIVCNGRIKELDCKYNFKRDHIRYCPKKRKIFPLIIHYVGPNKPWIKYTFNHLKRLYYKYEMIYTPFMRKKGLRRLFWIISSIIRCNV